MKILTEKAQFINYSKFRTMFMLHVFHLIR